MRYDITLKTLFHRTPTRLLQLLIGQPVVETLTVEYPSVQKRLPDRVLRLADESNYHLELQSDPDRAMPWRMLEYYGLIRQHDDRPLVQQVLYVGKAENTLATGLIQDRLHFQYEVIDIRDIDGQALLQSPAIEDNILALLCRLDDEVQAVRSLLGKIVQLDENARNDALEQIFILSGLRDLKPIIQREVRQMPITIDLRENEFFREAFQEERQQGRQEGEHLLLTKMLERRFGPLPDEAVKRLQTAEPEALERWGLALLSARTLDEVFQ